jgi:hypothetical protein
MSANQYLRIIHLYIYVFGKIKNESTLLDIPDPV